MIGLLSTNDLHLSLTIYTSFSLFHIYTFPWDPRVQYHHKAINDTLS
jgi:hypothetical protein